MASPAVVGTPAETAISTAGTSHVVNLPSGASGNLLLAIMDKGSTSATVNALTGWTELLDEASANGLYIAYRVADGTEGTTTTFTLSAATRGAWIVYEISGAIDPATQAPQIGTTATGTSATPDPPSITPTGGSKDYLFVAFAGMAGEEADDDTWGNTPPTSYTPSPPRQKSCGVAGTNLGGLILSAERQLTASTDNPGTFGVDVSAAWRAQTIAVHPLPPPTSTAVARISLAAANTPASRVEHSIRIRGRVQSGAGTLRAALYEGTTNRSGDLESSALTTSLANYLLLISDANAANITDYSNLELRIWGYNAAGATNVFEVAEASLVLPDAAGGTTYNDNSTGTLALSGTNTESTAHTGTGSVTLTLSGAFTQSWSVIDAQSGTITLTGVRLDALTTADTRAGTLTLAGTSTQSYSHSGSSAGTLTLSGTQTQSYAHTASGAGTVVLSGTATENHFTGYTDSGSGTIVVSGTQTQSSSHTASRAGTLTVSGTQTQSASHTASVAGTLTLTGSKTETWGHFDAGSGTVTLTGARSETQSHTRSGAGTVTISGTATESWFGGATYNDARSGTITLTGSNTQSYAHTGTRSGTATLSGTAIESHGGPTSHTGSGTITFTLSGSSTEWADIGTPKLFVTRG